MINEIDYAALAKAMRERKDGTLPSWEDMARAVVAALPDVGREGETR